MELLYTETGRRIIIALAVLGGRHGDGRRWLGRGRTKGIARLALLVLWSGYALSSASVALLIVTGFLPGR